MLQSTCYLKLQYQLVDFTHFNTTSLFILFSLTEKWIHYTTCANQVSAQSISEVVEHTVPVLLHHLCVDVEARIAKLGNFLG